MGKWVALECNYISTNDRISLAWLDNGTIYWDGGPGNCPFEKEKHIVLEEYDWPKREPRDDVFFKKYGPQPNLIELQSAGWVSPDGRWWACNGWEHDWYARALSYMEYGEYVNQRWFDGKGWIRVYPEGLCSHPQRLVNGDEYDSYLTPVSPTMEQFDVLKKLVDLDPSSMYGEKVAVHIIVWSDEQ